MIPPKVPVNDGTFKWMFQMHKILIEFIMDVKIENNPMEFYLAINGLTEEAIRTEWRDLRWKSYVRLSPGGDVIYDHEQKVFNISNLVLLWIGGCAYSDITPDRLTEWFGDEEYTVEKYFRSQKERLKLERPSIKCSDNPLYFYYSINALINKAHACLSEDQRWKNSVETDYITAFHYDKNKKEALLLGIFKQIANVCIYSGISAKELMRYVDDNFNASFKMFKDVVKRLEDANKGS